MAGRIYLLNDNADLLAMEEAHYDSENLLQEHLAFVKFLLDNSQRIMATASMAKAETSLVEFVVEDRFDHVQNGRLHDPISNRGNPQGSPRRAARFRNPNSAYRTRAVSPLA